MGFDDLPECVRDVANAQIKSIVSTERGRGLKRIQDEREMRASLNQPAMEEDELLASLVRWPVIATAPPHGSGETVFGAGSRTYALQYGKTSAYKVLSVRTAKPRALDYLVTLGLSRSEAEQELWRWFDLAPRVFGIVRACEIGGADQMLVGVRSEDGTLSIPNTRIHLDESLVESLAREIYDEVWVSGLSREAIRVQLDARGVFTSGPRSLEPGVAFVSTVQVSISHKRKSRANFLVATSSKWEGGGLVWVAESSVREALAGDHRVLSSIFAARGINVSRGFTSELAAPLSEQLDCWREGLHRGSSPSVGPITIR